MNWNHWEHWYNKIISDFNYNPHKDAESAYILNELLHNSEKRYDFHEIKTLIKDKIVFIYGCGPSLPEHVKKLKNSEVELQNYIHIAADGATSALLQFDITPNIIVTDLDGEISDQIKANKNGAFIIIHAHGDNIENINRYFSAFSGKLFGTTQNKPLSSVKNFGGFTDGDRCIFLAEEMEASAIILFGFDFGNIVGRFSKPNLNRDALASEMKIKKLQWAEHLISQLSTTSRSTIIKVNGTKLRMAKVKIWEFKEVIEFLKKSNEQ
ncbi:MAG TPA: 6-hydroxymethylpterin diphosphokinase MptE-like protein [Candidatus Deferrimicrobium sp.]|nr:6-hydroxymethylpterin diphosphokinase MptE-like protein [Candidatus Deferrimicrobium sp.]